MLKMSSPAFKPDQPIPQKFARDGENFSPPLGWSGAPRGTKSFALIVEDPDAPSGTFRHWALYNIDRDQDELPEGIGKKAKPASVVMAVNDFGKTGYDGPQPPRGDGPHHYHFRLFALDTEKLECSPGASVADILNAARSHAIGEADLVGTYQRA
jgi:Raf kinase inhibitor-like YbhB/YbcL family protein